MKKYPSISRDILAKVDITAFNKLDGSNIRAEWSPKRGFYKFGSRRVLLDPENIHIGKAVALIKENYEDNLIRVFKKQRWSKNIVCFFEYYGDKSFAGQHEEEDNHQVTLIDVSPYKQGLIPPRQFIKWFGDCGIPDILYRGKANTTFVECVRNSELEGMTLEGVVCKAPNPNGKITSQPLLFKVKSLKWLEMVKAWCQGDEKLYQKLI